jgi:hypothetical protein
MSNIYIIFNRTSGFRNINAELGETAFESFTETETGVSAKRNYGTEQFLRTYVY